ncbi:Glyoxalase/Bleomycin resistance protein/Dihydroxybiphenyl dioxygenase [Xylariaceae sp. FL1651]|nr:Glyoxalase/Bleomycin resistance protein/Dihydroxybiphenyl dioxygenase [Xylariaceae sp. FL1651]
MLPNYLFTALLLESTSLACALHMPPREAGNTTRDYSKTVVGPEVPDPDTTAYNLNHFALNVKNATRSIDFYTQAFGMRLMLTVQATEHFPLSYLAYSTGEKNGTGYQTTDELIRNQHNSQGLMELINYNNPNNDLPASTAATNTFSHVGLIVPDIDATQGRLEKYGVMFYKKVGGSFEGEGPLANAFGLNASEISQAELGALLGLFNVLTENAIFVADPDGNVLEILPQDGASLAN